MPKNTHGGSGHKKFARKHSDQAVSNSNYIRRSESELEVYAIATKMLGNKMFHCHCIDNKARLCHIRGRFDGRNKRTNMVSLGTWILVGLREWENSSDLKKPQQCDLLEVYSSSAKERLKDIETVDWSILNANDLSKVATDVNAKNDEDDFRFETDRDAEIERLTKEMQNNTKRIQIDVKKGNEKENEEEEVDIDDI